MKAVSTQSFFFSQQDELINELSAGELHVHTKFHEEVGHSNKELYYVDVERLIESLVQYDYLHWLAQYSGHHVNSCAEHDKEDATKLVEQTDVKW